MPRVRAVDEVALRRVCAGLHKELPASVVRRVVEGYVREQRRAALAKNPKLALMAGLKVGERAPWPYRALCPKNRPNIYMQGPETERARDLLGNFRARWRLSEGDEGRIVERVS